MRYPLTRSAARWREQGVRSE